MLFLEILGTVWTFPALWLLGTSQWGKAVLLRVVLVESLFQEALEQPPGENIVDLDIFYNELIPGVLWI